jgi:pimeloyl-ACP methyl ester carboxylesterase
MAQIKLAAATIAAFIASLAVAAPAAATPAAKAKSIAGDWQGTLHQGPGIRISVHFDRAQDGSWSGKFYVVDKSPDGYRLDSVRQDGAKVSFTFDALHLLYSGTLDARGMAIAGAWSQGTAIPLTLDRVGPSTMWARDSSPHEISFVEAEKGVRLEVLDWGGTGQPIILLAGLGNSAHVFDKLAPELARTAHVYGITRRGFGESSVPPFTRKNYAADRLGDDVLAVMSSLAITRPLLIGHSIAGAELSSIGSRFPDKVAGLVYLEAGYSQGYYNKATGDLLLDSNEVAAELETLNAGAVADPRALAHRLLDSDLPRLRSDLERQADKLPPAGAAPVQPPPGTSASQAILAGLQKYDAIPVPILAIFAIPHDLGDAAPRDPAARAAAEANDAAVGGAQADAFQAGLPSAKVVRIAHARHYVFQSNQAEILGEIRAFLERLKRPAGP